MIPHRPTRRSPGTGGNAARERRKPFAWLDQLAMLPVSSRAGEITAVLILMERAFAARMRRLEAAELRLRKDAARSRLASGRRTLRHIEDERRRLGRELHTGIGQLLAAIRIQLEIVREQCADAPPGVAQAVDRIERLAADALEQVRSLSHAIYPPEWQSLSLDAALYQLWNHSGIAQRFTGDIRVASVGDLNADVKTLFYRAAQEGLGNAMRHSRASSIDLSLEHSAGRLRLTIEDDGVGFDAARVFHVNPNPGCGLGLRALREQVAALGGRLRVDSGRAGTTLEVSVPLPS